MLVSGQGSVTSVIEMTTTAVGLKMSLIVDILNFTFPAFFHKVSQNTFR